MRQWRLLKLRVSCALAAVAVSAWALGAHADDTVWQVHGAFTQGIVYSSDNNFYGPSDDDASFEFTEINLNGSARLRQNLRVSGQVLYRHTGAQSDSANVDYLFLDYQFHSSNSNITGVRGGRYKVPLGLYDETRDVAFTRPSIYVPQSVYPDTARDLSLSVDGAVLYTNIFTDHGQWSVELEGGRPRVDERTVKSTLGFLPGETSDVGRHGTYGARVMYQSSDGEWIAAFTSVNVRVNFEQALAPMLHTDVDVELDYWLASLQYNIADWTFTGEYGHMDISLDIEAAGEYGLRPLVYYLQATRRLDQRWSVYGRWDNLYWDRDNRNGGDFALATGYNDFDNFARDHVLGVRADLSSNMMVSAELHYIDGTAWLSIYDNPEPAIRARHWTMVAMEFSYRF